MSVGSSPLTRGKLMSDDGNSFEERLIPAHAGKTCEVPVGEDVPEAHPRSRGENS